MSCPTVTLNTGQRMPLLGLGTSKTKGDTIRTAIDCALQAGYRHFDCACVYGNESDIGKSLHKRISNGTVKRENLFISGKLGCSFQHPDCVSDAFERSLQDLSLDYLDLFYMHWPFGLKYKGPENYFPTGNDGALLFDENINFVDTWRAMEKLYYGGKVKAIGVCNFNIKQLQRILDECNVKPAVHQVECHPYLHQDKIVEFCKSRGIAVVAYSPLCSSDRPNLPQAVSLFSEPILMELSRKYNKTIAQIVLCYQTQKGIAVIPRSTNCSRISENIDLFDFEITLDDLAKIHTLEKNARIMYPEKFENHLHFPFELKTHAL